MGPELRSSVRVQCVLNTELFLHFPGMNFLSAFFVSMDPIYNLLPGFVITIAWIMNYTNWFLNIELTFHSCYKFVNNKVLLLLYSLVFYLIILFKH